MKKTNVSKEFSDAIRKLSMPEVYEMLQEKVTALNEGVSDDELRVELNAECAELCKKYNELSVLTSYSEFAKAEYPILEFAQTFYYPTVSTKDELAEDMVDGKKHTYVVRQIEGGEKRLDLFDFLQWAEKSNKKVTNKKLWRTPCRETRNAIATEWQKFFNSSADSTKINKKAIQENLQKMYDALLFIPSDKGNNRVMATKKMAGMLFGFANTSKDRRVKDSGEIEISNEVIPEKQWIKLVMYALHLTVKDKNYAPNELNVKFGFDETSEPELPQTETEPEETKTESDSEAKTE